MLSAYRVVEQPRWWPRHDHETTLSRRPYRWCERNAEEAFPSSKAAMTEVPGIGGKATTNRTVLGELELGSGGTVSKRVRR